MFPSVLLLTSWILLVLVSGVVSVCPRGYEYRLQNSCYLFSHDKENWTGAMISCSVLDGHLVEIDSQEEQAFLAQKDAESGGSSRWIGLSKKRANTWAWATSRRSLDGGNLTAWAYGEPDSLNHHGDESCVVMDTANGHAFNWADVQCDLLEKYICEAQSG